MNPYLIVIAILSILILILLAIVILHPKARGEHKCHQCGSKNVTLSEKGYRNHEITHTCNDCGHKEID